MNEVKMTQQVTCLFGHDDKDDDDDVGDGELCHTFDMEVISYMRLSKFSTYVKLTDLRVNKITELSFCVL
jgi:hypothetical protein